MSLVQTLTYLIRPFSLLTLLLLLAMAWPGGRARRFRWLATLLALLIVLLFGTNVLTGRLGLFLEQAYPPREIATLPQADVIVVLGGGVGGAYPGYPHPELFSAADRVWHAARLYHAGKAPFVMPSGMGEGSGSYLFLRDLGVPAEAIILETNAVNTLDHTFQIKPILEARGFESVLLVTSAFHMRRAHMLFQRMNIACEPAATDHEMLYGVQRTGQGAFSLEPYLPSAMNLERAACYVKEIVGYIGDTWRLHYRLADDKAKGP